MVPFREIVLKVHSRCDLACDHCYIYEHADQSWRTRPKAISDQAISWTALRLAEHAKKHALPSVSVILHGGEPLLAGPARLRRVCEELTTALAPLTELDLRIHTNGLQLSPRYLDLFDEYGVKVGISLDGDKTANDRHRRFADGRSSHPLVLRAIDLLRQERYRHLDLGLLCTIDVANDPVTVYDALLELSPPRIDFLLPHATWEEPPARPDGSPTAYAEWLLTVFDRWNDQGRPVPVRLFESVLSTLGGGPSLTESLGLAPTDLVVVETDGTLEQVDSLKSAYEGAAATGFDVFRHSFDEVAAHPGVRVRQLGLDGVSDTCRRCPVVRSCGGGLYTHRYRAANGFDNPSVYCADLEALVRGVEDRTATATAAPAVADPAALVAEQHDLTRVLLAELHSELGGRGGEAWAEAWELAGAVERRSDGLDEVLAHPYTRTWLLDCLDALREGRAGAADLAGQLARHVAAAAVRGRVDVTVRIAHPGGGLHLPTLGTAEVTGPVVGVRTTGDGLLLRGGDGELRVERLLEEGAGWRPVRRGAHGVALDDLDPCRDGFGAPATGRLTRAEAAAWAGRLERAWALLRDAVPDQADEAAASLTTLTPLTTTGGPSVGGRHGYGALGLSPHEEPGTLARTLLSGFRRAKLRALLDVADLYALDGAWTHAAPWREAPVPVSDLLAGAYERVGLAAYEHGHADHAERALDLLENAAELTVSGKLLVAEARKELCRSRDRSVMLSRG
ncbi:FxsB family radical SAM/SPASM domain protein [Streptomyces sp. WAC05374]|nr:FxsB family radical SAM/SPASM domain protein [Streptomyces sp. WAC05374]TDF40765.1 FxsB family radical SAM/SPASM domain protein [Streptomyces sp. WAC05374]TDF49498.1 FxsB family radical SAM/SPASM domain protein [Streptomyces sp. WAC05374]TDF49982.1 FxsB family radical SAM/SPASM domain protein [Streptomyces sp. WAC05374]